MQLIDALKPNSIIGDMIRKFDRQKDFVLTRQQVRDFDSWAINTASVPGVVLMENAGRSCAEIVIDELKKRGGSKVCIFCGTGNNGGDGFVIARHLKNAGFDVVVGLCGPRLEGREACGPSAKIKGDALVNYKIASNMKIAIEELADRENSVRVLAKDCDLIVDAIFGTGLTGSLAGGFDKLINTINSLGKLVIAVDIPSGLDCDTGEPLETAVKAIATVTFAAAKKGFKNPKSAEYTGDVYIASIGIEPEEN
ncbi:MAG: NAD(P)H-hydrate epimerase [Planctomycetes bacterium HGW-Planctomycetes-1]|nr:MAG: NAD(P)H-hydrate epimerase [Planctomycetes bacterium HGW-Planctomycetes-1]